MAWANGLVMNWIDWRGGRQFGRKEEMRRTVGLRVCSICLMLFARWMVGDGRRVVLLQGKRNPRANWEKSCQGMEAASRLLQHSDSISTIDRLANHMGINSTEG